MHPSGAKDQARTRPSVGGMLQGSFRSAPIVYVIFQLEVPRFAPVSEQFIMKMPTNSAGSRPRSKAKATAKAPARKNTLTRSVKPAGSSNSKGKAAVKAGRKAAPKAQKIAKAKPAPKTAQATGAAQTTTNHAKIQKWAEARKGVPSTVKITRTKKEPGILRIDFPGFSGKDTLQKISWNEWFEKFDESGLAFLYQDKMKDGKQSRFFKLVKK